MTPVDNRTESPRSGAEAADRIRELVRRVHRDSSFGAADAVRAAAVADIDALVYGRLSAADVSPVASGVGASPGVATGRLVVTAEAAMDAADDGEDVILVRPETGPEDVLGMRAARGVVTARGGSASHAAVVARGWGLPAIVGVAGLDVHDDAIEINGYRIVAGEYLSIDGSSGHVFTGAAPALTQVPCLELDELLGWADELRTGRIGIRANADDEVSALTARDLGAEGIGLCRTEHMFFAADRLELMRRLILADSDEPDPDVLAALEEVQCNDFRALLTVMAGRPVCVRLLDPPLHEFLPDFEALVAAEAQGSLDADAANTLAAVRRLREVNPMMGVRGVRLAMVKPWIYPMQTRALVRAVDELRRGGAEPRVELMVPLVINADELVLARSWFEPAVDAGIRIGTMIETPSAAILAGALAEHADFFSFGTNDLTQLTLGLSRDDAEATLLPLYLGRGALRHNPFVRFDKDAVGPLIQHAVEAARRSGRAVTFGVCGEQAADPDSIGFFVDCGVDYVSCSPHRLPVVRLAAAQALLERDVQR